MAKPSTDKWSLDAFSVEDLADGVLSSDRASLGRAITLVESRLYEHQEKARSLLVKLLPHTGRAHRIGISGVPGVGKSTFIDRLGCNLIEDGHRVSVLAVDPTSRLSGGSILGDKTRMPNLAGNETAFIRPSPSAGSLGGVAGKTREAMLLCEAAGYDVVLVETMGVGQSETTVGEMVDFFLVLMLPGAGDELQGIKKGILEVADMLALNKADGDNIPKTEMACREYTSALELVQRKNPNWQAPILAVSSLKNTGLDTLWEKIEEHRRIMEASGDFQETRRKQLLHWTWAIVEEKLMGALREHPGVKQKIQRLEKDVLAERLTPAIAADTILKAFGIGKID